MKKTFWIILFVFSLPIHADVFKCTSDTGKVIYQARPCLDLGQEQNLHIKSDPDKEAAAKAALDALHAERQTKKEAIAQAEKEARTGSGQGAQKPPIKEPVKRRTRQVAPPSQPEPVLREIDTSELDTSNISLDSSE